MNITFIRNMLYSLKRRFGHPMEYVYKITTSTDTRTGKVTITRDSFRIKKAILLPTTLERNFSYDLTFIASNKNFTYGGIYDTNERRIILDGNDLPNQFEPETGQSLIFDGKRWDIKEAQKFQVGKGYLILARQVANMDLKNLIKRFIHSDLILTDTVEVIKV